jgi:hydroxyethylthiazole kinase-like uncharacterized protein yjeF
MPYRILSTQSLREVEAAADSGGLSYAQLMQNAGRAAAERCCQLLGQRAAGARVTVLVGPGNNGGDALVTGLLLASEAGAQVRFYLLRPRPDDPHFQQAEANNLFIAQAEDDQRYRVLHNLVASADLIIDGLFGIGTRPPLRPEAARLLRAVQQALHDGAAEQRDYHAFLSTPAQPLIPPRRPLIVALDCPSGIDCDSGAVDPAALPADETITFVAAKPGLLTFPAAALVGRLTLSTLGVPPTLPAMRTASPFIAGAAEAAERLPARPLDAHKGSFGRLLIVGGSAQYYGAPLMAALAAYRAGAGLACLDAPEALRQALAAQAPEVIWHPAGAALDDAQSASGLLIGPGLGTDALATQRLEAALQVTTGRVLPAVVDADALTLLARMPDWPARFSTPPILTPHPGEMARLCGLTTSEVQADRWALAQNKAQEWRSIVLLKGAHTVIASPDGDVAVLPFKTPALAKAGSGDVLAGLIAGLIVQGCSGWDAAICGAVLHALAGEAAANTCGSARAVLASDVLASVGQALQALEPLATGQ